MPVLEFFNLDKKYNNCWYYATMIWIRQGGYVVVGDSEYGWWGHYSHTFDFINFTEFTTDTKHKRPFPPPIYPGYINDYYRKYQVY